MPTLKDIANKLGISHVAVSYAINGKPGVSNDIRKKVFEVAQEIGYRPNAGAVAMRNGAFKTIGLIMSSDYDFSYFSQGLFSGIMHEFAEQNYSLNITHLAPNKHYTLDTVPPTIRNKQVDGYIIYYTKNIPEYLTQMVADNNTEAVWVNTKTQKNSICPDDFQGGKMLTEYLIKLGHSKILYTDLNMPQDEVDAGEAHYSVFERENGYIQAMVDHGFKPQTFRFSTRPDRYNLHKLTQDIIQTHKDITAIISYSCNGALTLRTATESLGKSCPSDISIASFKEEVSAFDLLDLTTAIVPDKQMGEMAVKKIVEAVENKTNKNSLTLIPYSTIDEGYTTTKLNHSLSQ